MSSSLSPTAGAATASSSKVARTSTKKKAPTMKKVAKGPSQSTKKTDSAPNNSPLRSLRSTATSSPLHRFAARADGDPEDQDVGAPLPAPPPTVPTNDEQFQGKTKAPNTKKKVAKGPSKSTKKRRGNRTMVCSRPSAADTDPSTSAAIFENLGLLTHVLSFVGKDQYRFVAPTNHQFKEAYLRNFPDCTTALDASTLARTKICYEECSLDYCDHLVKEYGCEFALGVGCDLGLDTEDESEEKLLYKSAALHKDIQSLQYLFCEDKHFGYEMCSAAARTGDLKELKWWRSIGCPWNEDTCREAADQGHLNVLQYCRANGCPWNEYSLNDAAFKGHLHVVKWCRANGFPWNTQTVIYEAMKRHAHVLEWYRKEDPPSDSLTYCYFGTGFNFSRW